LKKGEKMKTMMNFGKKMLMSTAMAVVLCVGLPVFAERCQSCDEKLAIKQSIKDALAAAIAAKPSARERELEKALEKCGCNKPRPPRTNDSGQDAESVDAEVEKCGCNKPRPPRPSRDMDGDEYSEYSDEYEMTAQELYQEIVELYEELVELYENQEEYGYRVKPLTTRDPRNSAANEVVDSGCCQSTDELVCLISKQLEDMSFKNAACCKVVHRINEHLKSQGRDAKKCCSRLNRKIDDIEDLVESQIDQSADCCSSTDVLILSVSDALTSQIEAVTTCCSLNSAALVQITAIVTQILGCTCL